MPEKDVIFISWSGKDTASFRMAEILYKVLPVVFQSAQFFMSDDISKGTIGISEILQNLSKSKIGIICVTKANVEKTWLNFEAGALTSSIYNKNGRAMALLLDMTTDELASANSPIRNLQATTLEESDLYKMFLSINNSLNEPLKESQLKYLFDSLVKKEILQCDVSAPLIMPKPQTNRPPAPRSDGMTKDAKKLLKALYRSYVLKKSEGLSISDASSFNDVNKICSLSNMNAADVKMLYNELSDLGYLRYDSDDLFEMVISSLTSKGIKYGESNFDEPTYIILLRNIVKQYNSRRGYISSDSLGNYSYDDVAVLNANSYIKMSKYINGDFSVKPTDAGITEIALRDKE